uniref:Uncharacterized protein n=1 Tax=Caenorhabditis japonica TaxID=281687 RepID=A0A8R1ICT2_CAEJA
TVRPLSSMERNLKLSAFIATQHASPVVQCATKFVG